MKKNWRKPLWNEAEEPTAAEDEMLAEAEENLEEPTEEAAPEEGFDTAAGFAELREELSALRAELAAFIKQAQVAAVNERNSERSAGRLSPQDGEEYFSPNEVRAMSREAVRDNYERILRSMKHWH